MTGMTGKAKVERLGARDLLDAVLDPGSWQNWDTTPQQVAVPGSAYAQELVAAEAKAGTDESLITGQGTLQGRPVALVVSEFRFLAGSIGHAAAERLVLAVERATRDGLPLIGAPASGGTRMQEGTNAFVGMVKISAAVRSQERRAPVSGLSAPPHDRWGSGLLGGRRVT